MITFMWDSTVMNALWKLPHTIWRLRGLAKSFLSRQWVCMLKQRKYLNTSDITSYQCVVVLVISGLEFYYMRLWKTTIAFTLCLMPNPVYSYFSINIFSTWTGSNRDMCDWRLSMCSLFCANYVNVSLQGKKDTTLIKKTRFRASQHTCRK